ncbi:MAG: TIM barrel protein [Chitinophagaceae bacterium]
MNNNPGKIFEISLAEFSLAESLYTGKLDNLDFPAKAKNDFGIEAVEYVSGFWQDKATDRQYLRELKKRADDAGVKNVLIMVDAEGELGASSSKERNKAVENHYKWIDAAKYLDCFAIRVNIDGDGSPAEIMKAAIDGYGKLLEYGAKENIHVLIENHMTISTDPDWLSGLLRQTSHPYAGALPDFGNFTQHEMHEISIEAFKDSKIVAKHDKYDAVKKLMPYAKAISAKTISFDEEGNCTDTDYNRMMNIVKNGLTEKFFGYIGIEYGGYFMKMIGDKGHYLSEEDAIRATKRLLENALMNNPLASMQ